MFILIKLNEGAASAFVSIYDYSIKINLTGSLQKTPPMFKFVFINVYMLQ
jgi:hypothetical protein